MKSNQCKGSWPSISKEIKRVAATSSSFLSLLTLPPTTTFFFFHSGAFFYFPLFSIHKSSTGVTYFTTIYMLILLSSLVPVRNSSRAASAGVKELTRPPGWKNHKCPRRQHFKATESGWRRSQGSRVTRWHPLPGRS